MKKKIFIGLAVAAVVVLCCCLAFCGNDKREVSFETAVIGNGDISNSVTATGTIEPVTSVDVGTQVSGIVANIYVDYNSVVKKGQVIAELDKTNLVSEVNTAKASLNNAQSQLTYQKANYNRYSTLYKKGLVSADEYETALLAYRQAQDEVKQRRESLQQAQTNLGYATITSPVDGVVLSREVEEGQTVAANFETPTLFTIAQDLTDMRVIADVDEADIGEVREGERVTFTVDAYPDDTFSGTVTQVRQEGNTEGFRWSAINGTRSSNNLKFCFKSKSVNDVQGMSLCCVTNVITPQYVTAICNSDFISRYTEAFINSTVIFQINDCRQIPIIIPNKDEIAKFSMFFEIAKEYVKLHAQDMKYSDKLQLELNNMVLQLYRLLR